MRFPLRNDDKRSKFHETVRKEFMIHKTSPYCRNLLIVLELVSFEASYS